MSATFELVVVLLSFLRIMASYFLFLGQDFLHPSRRKLTIFNCLSLSLFFAAWHFVGCYTNQATVYMKTLVQILHSSKDLSTVLMSNITPT